MGPVFIDIQGKMGDVIQSPADRELCQRKTSRCLYFLIFFRKYFQIFLLKGHKAKTEWRNKLKKK